MNDISIILEVIRYGPAAVLVVGGMMEWYVWGPTYKRALEERDAWKAVALKTLNIVEKV